MNASATIAVSFQPEEGHFRRSILLPGAEQPIKQIVKLPTEIYPRFDRPFEQDLWQLPPGRLKEIGRSVFELALGKEGAAEGRPRFLDLPQIGDSGCPTPRPTYRLHTPDW